MNPEFIGWAASCFLVASMSYQVFTQWRSGNSDGVSPWLFVGMFTAASGFTVYAVMVENLVFIVTNGLVALSAALGLAICLHHRSRIK